MKGRRSNRQQHPLPVTLHPSPRRFGLVVSRFNEPLTRPLLAGALDTLARRGVARRDVDTVWVPGAFEIPVVLHRLAVSGRYRALVALGVVIRGATHHYDAICREVARGVADTARTTGVPVGFGVIMATRRAEAVARAGGRWNLGGEAAAAALATAQVLEQPPCAP